MIEVRIASLAIDPRTDQPVVILRPLDEEGPQRFLPIWIGHPEATAILLALEGVETSRPMTHDLLAHVVEATRHEVDRIEITHVREGTFFARIILSIEDETVAVDARPSDSLALAVRTGAPILVAVDVLDEASVPDDSVVEEIQEAEIEAFREFLDHVDPEDFRS